MPLGWKRRSRQPRASAALRVGNRYAWTPFLALNRRKCSSPKVGLHTDAVLGFCPAFGARVLVTYDGVGYSFWWKILFGFTGSVSVWFCVWYSEKFTKWPKIARDSLSFMVSILFLGFMTPPVESQFNREYNVRLSFKEFPVAFTL